MNYLLAKSINCLFLTGRKTAGKKNILVYADKGVSFFSAVSLYKRVKNLVDVNHYNIRFVNSIELKDASWLRDTKLFIMPGGRSKPFYTSLQHNGNQLIVDFVKEGGNYLGVCAGAYYGCATTEFEKARPLEVILEGPLNFYPGKAIGPAYGLGEFRYRSQAGAKLAKITWLANPMLQDVGVYYNGGCFFDGATSDKNIQVLARYTDLQHQPPAIVSCQVAKGRTILSGVHLETNYPFMWLNPIKRNGIYKGLLQFEAQRTIILRDILQRFDIICDNTKSRIS